ncbi:MAG: HU family DNA-binding protein [Desulfohalobiaceae bacterium]|nr:HU family DNA-binding protein [Desulfohalobiaceae bacterium]
MSKQRLADQIKVNGMSKAKTKQVVDSILEAITEGLDKEGKVNLKGFGAFSVVEQKERKGRNPQTREEMTIPGGKRVKFKAGNGLQGRV